MDFKNRQQCGFGSCFDSSIIRFESENMYIELMSWFLVPVRLITLPETNIAPENGWSECQFPFGMAYFHVLCLFQGEYY